MSQQLLPLIEINEWSYSVDEESVLTASRQGIPLVRLTMRPRLDGDSPAILGWKKLDRDSYEAELENRDKLRLSVDCGHVCFWVETDALQLENLAYFDGATFEGNAWQTYVSDEHDRKWDADIDQEVGISSAYDGANPFGADGNGMTDPGDFPVQWIWNVPVRAFAFETSGGWFGFSIPGALPVGVTRPSMSRRRFTLNFDLYRANCTNGVGPKVYFVTGFGDPYDLLDEHRIISTNLGMTVPRNAPHPKWWSNGEFYYWDEFCRLERENPEDAKNQKIITGERLKDWLHQVKKDLDIQELNMPMEQGCYRLYGDYTPTDRMGGQEGFRKIVDELREEGTHTGFYIHPFMFNSKVDFYKEHSEAFCRPKTEGYKTEYALEYDTEAPVFHLLDWTHPTARAHMQEQIRRILSDEPGCLNCDILRSNHWRSPDPRMYNFYDPDWGVGDMMTCKVQRLIYETAKQIKPDCLVTKIGIADAYMQPYADVSFLCEEWNGYTDNWYRRGRIGTRTVPDLIFYTDSWFITITKGYEYYLGMLAWNFPSTETIRHTIHPYIYWREFQEKDYKRRKSGFHVGLFNQLKQGDLCRVDFTPQREAIQWRKNGSGPLKGFYAAIGIGKRSLVAYQESEARIATSITRTVEFPLPPGAAVRSVEMVPHEGQPVVWSEYSEIMTKDGPGLRMWIEDCGKDALYYRVNYKMP